MTDLVYQTTLGGNLTLRATNTASNPIITIPAVTANMVTTGDTATVTANMIVPGALSQTATYTQGGTGAVSRTIQNKLQESISVLDFGADNTGATDCSSAVLAAITAANHRAVYFPAGTYKFSVSISSQALCTRFYGDATGSTNLVPLSSTKPCFILNIVSFAYPPTSFQLQFLQLNFIDSGSQTSCGIWTRYGIYLDKCNFKNLKYGIIGNTAEYSVLDETNFTSCYFGVYATTANSSNDPLGISTDISGNPSEWYFYNCQFQGGNLAYYEEQPDNIYDQTTWVYFNSCQIFNNYGIATIGGAGYIKLDKSWFEGRSGSEPDIVVNGHTIKSSIIYTEGASVILDNVFGLDNKNPIYVKYSTTARLTQTANSNPPRLTIVNTEVLNGYSVNLDAGIIGTFDRARCSNNGGTDLTPFVEVNNVNLYDASNGIVFNSPNMPINRMASGGALVNLFPNGTCAGTAPLQYGSFTSSIVSGNGFINNSGFKYLQSISVPNNNGYHISGSGFTTITNYFYVMTFALRQNSGSNKQFFIKGYGVANPLSSGVFSCPGDNQWRFYTFLASCPTGGASGDVVIANASGGNLSFDMSAIQLVAFATNQQAQQFINSNVYVDPVSL
jgi:hypothetical protein